MIFKMLIKSYNITYQSYEILPSKSKDSLINCLNLSQKVHYGDWECHKRLVPSYVRYEYTRKTMNPAALLSYCTCTTMWNVNTTVHCLKIHADLQISVSPHPH